MFTLDLLEDCAGEGRLVQPQGAPHLYQGREDHPEGEGPDREDHQQDVQPGVDVVIAAVVGDQHISERKTEMLEKEAFSSLLWKEENNHCQMPMYESNNITALCSRSAFFLRHWTV